MAPSKTKIESINIGLASPIRIRKWAERILPNGKKIGQVLNSKTVNYKTLKPEIGGLFCEKIFGPIKDFECLCGFKKSKFKTQTKFCPICDVEFTASRIRRYRLGYIKLASPVTHIWYLRGRPRFLNILFDMSVALNKGKIKDLKPIIYGVDAIYLPILKLIKTNTLVPSINIDNAGRFVPILSMHNYVFLNFYNYFQPFFSQIPEYNFSINTNKNLTTNILKNTPQFNNCSIFTKKTLFHEINSNIFVFQKPIHYFQADNIKKSSSILEISKYQVINFFAKNTSELQNHLNISQKNMFHWVINYVYFSQKWKKKFFSYFYTKKTLFSKQLTKTFCNSYYFYYSLKTISRCKKVKNRKKKLNKFLKKKICIKLNKSQKILIFLLDSKIFLNKKKLKIESKQFFNQKYYVFSNQIKHSLIFTKKAHEVFSKQKKEKHTNLVLNGWKQNYFQRNSNCAGKIVTSRYNFSRHSFENYFQSYAENSFFKMPEKKKFIYTCYSEFYLSVPSVQIYQRKYISGTVLENLRSELVFYQINKKKMLIQLPFLLVVPRKRSFELINHVNSQQLVYPKKITSTSKVSLKKKLKKKYIFQTQNFVALDKYLNSFLNQDVTAQKMEAQHTINFSVLQKQNFCKIKITKIKLNLFFYYILKKKKFVNFNGKILSITKFNKKKILNLVNTIKLNKKKNNFINKSNKFLLINYNFLSAKPCSIAAKASMLPRISSSGAIKWYQKQPEWLKDIFWIFINQNLSLIDQLSPEKKAEINVNNACGNIFYKTRFLSCNRFLQQFKFPLQKKNLNTNEFCKAFNAFNLFGSNFIIFTITLNFNFSLNILNKLFYNYLLINVNYNCRTIYKRLFCCAKLFKHKYFKYTLKSSFKNIAYQPASFFIKNFSHNFFDLNNLPPNFQSQIYSYYPLSSKCIFKFTDQEKENKFEFKEFWESFLTYMISNSTEFDIKLAVYSNILKNLPFKITNLTLNCLKNNKNMPKIDKFDVVKPMSYMDKFDSEAVKPIVCLKEKNNLRQESWHTINNKSSGNEFVFFPIFKTRYVFLVKSKIRYKFNYNKTTGNQNFAVNFPVKTNCLQVGTKPCAQNAPLEAKVLCPQNSVSINFIKNDEQIKVSPQIFYFGFFSIVEKSSNREQFLDKFYLFTNKINLKQYKYVKILLTGTEAIFYWLTFLNLPILKTKFKNKLNFLNDKIHQFRTKSFLYDFQKKVLKKIIKIRRKNVRLMKLIYYLKKNKFNPEWLMISILPVLPPNLRPILQLNANQIAVSDLNQLYKRVIYRNKRIEKYLKKNYQVDSNEIKFHQRLLQESVDALLDNGKGGSPLACSPTGRPFKSLSEILKGKKGRFRQNLLGKRVDYSGRSVIIVDPKLKLHQCGLPKEMAVELFQPFLIRELRNLSKNTLINRKITIIKAKKLIKKKHPIIWDILKKILKNHPILLNRAPTLHRLGIQAFQSKLIEGKTIFLHPLVCSAFNADFDGDQMAVHVPLSFQARSEAWKLMWSRNNLLSPATGEPIITPSQDMVLGCYYLTTKKLANEYALAAFSRVVTTTATLKGVAENKNLKPVRFARSPRVPVLLGKVQLNYDFLIGQLFLNHNKIVLNKYFINLDEVLIAFFQKHVSIHSLVWVKWENFVENENFNEKPLEIRIDCYGNSIKIYSKYFQYLNNKNIKISHFILTTVGRILLNKIILENMTF